MNWRANNFARVAEHRSPGRRLSIYRRRRVSPRESLRNEIVEALRISWISSQLTIKKCTQTDGIEDRRKRYTRHRKLFYIFYFIYISKCLFKYALNPTAKSREGEGKNILILNIRERVRGCPTIDNLPRRRLHIVAPLCSINDLTCPFGRTMLQVSCVYVIRYNIDSKIRVVQ